MKTDEKRNKNEERTWNLYRLLIFSTGAKNTIRERIVFSSMVLEKPHINMQNNGMRPFLYNTVKLKVN